MKPTKKKNTCVALLISLYFPPETGGGATGAWNRALSLSKLGYLVFVLCGFPSFPSGRIADEAYKWKFFAIEKKDDINVLRMRLPSIQHKGYLRRLVLYSSFVFLSILFLPLILHQTGRLSLVYARAPIIFSNIPGIFYSSIQKSLYIYEAPDLWPEELGVFRTPLMPVLMRIGELMARASYRSPDIIITTAKSAAEFVEVKYNPRRPVFAIPVGVNPTSFQHIEREEAVRSLIDKDLISSEVNGKFLILYSGLISAAQNVESLVELAKKFESHDDIAFLIIGDGEARPQLEETIRELNLKNLFLIGRQPRQLMPLIIAAANMCAVTLSRDTIFERVIPSKFYEYVACSKPIVGICAGELAKLIEMYDVGYVIKSLDKSDGVVKSLLNLKDSPERYSELVQNCRAALNEFSIDAVSEKLGEIRDNYMEKRS